jgi:hypothetical protein
MEEVKRYSKKNFIADDSLSTVLENYKCKGEVDFVKTFFQKEEINSLLESCGLPILPTGEIEYEYPIKVGNNIKRADLLIKSDDSAFYVEVMSKSNDGKWDNSHHEQFIIKNFKLSKEFDSLFSFAISFQEFDPCFLDEISKEDNWFAIHLRFNNGEYSYDVYGVEEKKKKVAEFNEDKNKLGLELMSYFKSKGILRREEIYSQNYIYVGQGNHRKGIEYSMGSLPNRIGIKLYGGLYSNEFKWLADDIDSLLKHFKFHFPTLNFSLRKNTLHFDFNKLDKSEKNLLILKEVYECYSEYVGIK